MFQTLFQIQQMANKMLLKIFLPFYPSLTNVPIPCRQCTKINSWHTSFASCAADNKAAVCSNLFRKFIFRKTSFSLSSFLFNSLRSLCLILTLINFCGFYGCVIFVTGFKFTIDSIFSGNVFDFQKVGVQDCIGGFFTNYQFNIKFTPTLCHSLGLCHRLFPFYMPI